MIVENILLKLFIRSFLFLPDFKMPSSSVPLIELHFAKTLEDLKKKAEIAQKEKDALKKRDAKGYYIVYFCNSTIIIL